MDTYEDSEWEGRLKALRRTLLESDRKVDALDDKLDAKVDALDKKLDAILKHLASHGRLIDGLTGDRNIYRLRGEVPPEPGAFQSLPKRMYFLFDLSMSMSRYSMDGRLLRSLQSAVMIMESFKGFEKKYEYQIMGHSGDTDDLVLTRGSIHYFIDVWISPVEGFSWKKKMMMLHGVRVSHLPR